MRFLVLALLLTACSSCATFAPSHSMSRIQQYNAMVLVRTTCSDGRVGQGSGMLVSEDRVLTALHVVQCEIVPGVPIYLPANRIEVLATAKDVADADVELEISKQDVARLRLKTSNLAKFAAPVSIAPPPVVGSKVCVVSAVPRATYRCGEAQEQIPGRVVFSIFTEHGNSGSPVFDERGRLVGILTNLIACEKDIPCAGYGTSVIGYPWLVPGVAD